MRMTWQGGGAALVSATIVAVLAGCTDPGPQAQDAAVAFATAVADRDISGIAFTGIEGSSAQDHMTSVFEALGDIDLATTVEDVTVDDSDEEHPTAVASISYSWQVTPEQAWTYNTQVALDRSEGEGPPQWEVVWAPDMLVPDLKSNERLTTERLQPARAGILGQNDSPIVRNRPVYHIGIDKTWIDASRWDAQSRSLAALVGIDPEAYAQKVAGAGPKAFVEAITLRSQDPALDLDAIGAVEGATALPDEIPLAPSRDFARPILGRAGEATAEIVEESAGEIVAGDIVGTSGLQKQYDAQLRGNEGMAIAKQVPADQGGDGTSTELFRVDAVDGTPLRTTLDIELQLRAEKLLATVSVPSAIVAIRPSTGEVLTLASGAASEGLSTATMGQYAPGSTFKVATALAAIRQGVTPETIVSCTPQVTAGGYTFRNVPGYPDDALGEVPFRTAFANSCNTGMISLAGDASQQALHDAAADLGIGVSAELGIPAYFGDVPTQATDVEHAASMIGQGKIQVSPLAMATLAATVAQGARVSPVLILPNEASAETSTADAATTSPTPTAPSQLSAAEAETLRSLMVSVVADGSAGVLQDLGDGVGAKTGTAQYGDGSASHAWMIAFDGDLAVAVFLETGEGGAASAGPILHDFLAGL